MSNNAYDILIIGAGIMGCSSAFELASRGLSVAVLEKAGLGSGSTGKSSAIIRQHYSNEATARMALYSLQVFQDFAERVGGETGFRRTGFLVLTPEKDLQGLRENVALQQSVGIQTELLEAEELRRRWPYLETGDLVAAAYEEQAGYADPNLTVQSYAAAARRHGADFHLDAEVTGVLLEGGKVKGVQTTRGPFHAPAVVNCAGPWGARVARMAGVEAPIDPCRVQVAFFRRPPAHQTDHPVVADFNHAVYWRPETGGLTLVGLIDPSEKDAVVDPDGYREAVDFNFVADAGERLVSRFPAMEEGESAGGFAALYAITPDWHPYIDEVPQDSGFYLCAGFSGHGFKLGPAVGRMVADMVLGESTAGLDRRLFRFSRLAENDPVRGRYEYSIAG
jgi:glycine/D-amino acid oxidase-like deaminating enzyme